METSRHILFYCRVFVKVRLKHLDCNTFFEPGEQAGVNFRRLNKFVAGSRRFITCDGLFDPYLEVLGITMNRGLLLSKWDYSWAHN